MAEPSATIPRISPTRKLKNPSRRSFLSCNKFKQIAISPVLPYFPDRASHHSWYKYKCHPNSLKSRRRKARGRIWFSLSIILRRRKPARSAASHVEIGGPKGDVKFEMLSEIDGDARLQGSRRRLSEIQEQRSRRSRQKCRA